MSMIERNVAGRAYCLGRGIETRLPMTDKAASGCRRPRKLQDANLPREAMMYAALPGRIKSHQL